MYASRNFSQLFWRLVGIALGESYFFQTLVLLPNKNGVFSKHSRSPVGFLLRLTPHSHRLASLDGADAGDGACALSSAFARPVVSHVLKPLLAHF